MHHKEDADRDRSCSEDLPEEIPVDRLLREHAGVLEAGGAHDEGQLLLSLAAADLPLFRQNKRGLGIKESDVFSIRLFYPETSCVIIWFCNHEIKKAETSPTKV